MAAVLFKFESAIRGYHYYKKYWVPVENQKLDCVHEVGNSYDFFAIKTCESGSGKIVGHILITVVFISLSYLTPFNCNAPQ